MTETINTLRKEVTEELEGNILPFWMNKMTDRERGGFYGRISGEDVLMPDEPKGAILNARILWTFSAAYRLLKKPEYLATATRAKRYLLDFFTTSSLEAFIGRWIAKGIRSTLKNKSMP